MISIFSKQGFLRLDPVAIITGRSMKDMRERLPFEPRYVVANHGLEGLSGDVVPSARSRKALPQMDGKTVCILRRRPAARRWRLDRAQRRDPSHSAHPPAQLLAEFVPESHIVGGKKLFNLLPQDAGDKGRALEVLMQTGGFGSAIYVGDDLTVESVFSLRRREVVSVRLESAVDSSAKFFIDRHTGLARVLDELSARLSARHCATAGKSASKRSATPTDKTLTGRALQLTGEAS